MRRAARSGLVTRSFLSLVAAIYVAACGPGRTTEDVTVDSMPDVRRVDIVRDDVQPGFDIQPGVDVVSTDAADTVAIDTGGLDATGTDAAADGPVDTVTAADATGDALACDGATCSGLCVDLQTDIANCGSCGNDCGALTGVDRTAVRCVAGVCDVTGACLPGRGDCANGATDGCETDLSQPTNCGSCGTTCADPTPLCTMDMSGAHRCDSGCTGMTPSRCGMACVDLQSDATNCGACGTTCPGAFRATGACSAGTCVLACDAGYADCDANPANGCETNLRADSDHCGTCGNVCSVANGVRACVAGGCIVASCNPGFADCDMDATTGCERNTRTDPANCGTCGNVCTASGGMAVCNSGTCTIGSCDPGFGDCDSSVATGCETNLSTDVANCGVCARRCTLPNASPACTSGMCSIASCTAGFGDCDATASNGCEANLSTDFSNCGTCGRGCLLPNAASACAAGMCVISSCGSGFADCDSSAATGCETNIAADVSNCGMCGRVCTLPNAASGCSSGNCRVLACNSGFANCNTISADGCEVNTRTDLNHCGVCNNQCSVANGTAGCSAGACIVASCNPGFADCNGNPADGCEVNLSADSSNCGTCGVRCSTTCSGNVAGTTCSAGRCAITSCASGTFDVDGMCGTGCECSASSSATTCGTPRSLGSLAVGSSISYSGNLVPSGVVEFLAVTFTGNTNTSYHPHVTMTAGAAEFAFDILTNCSGGAIACQVEGGTSTTRTDWEVFYASAMGVPTNPVPPVGASGTVIIRVFRRPGMAVTCNRFTLAITN